MLATDPAPQVGAFYRSDHFPLAKMGVPALFPAAGFTGAAVNGTGVGGPVTDRRTR